MGFALEEIRMERSLKELNESFNAIFEMRAKMTQDHLNTLLEGVTDEMPTNLVDALDEAKKRLEAAYRGLGLLNKLPVGEQRSMHQSRITANMNRIKAMLGAVIRALPSELYNTVNPQDRQKYASDSVYGRPQGRPDPRRRQFPRDYGMRREGVELKGKSLKEDTNFDSNFDVNELYQKGRELVNSGWYTSLDKQLNIIVYDDTSSIVMSIPREDVITITGKNTTTNARKEQQYIVVGYAYSVSNDIIPPVGEQPHLQTTGIARRERTFTKDGRWGLSGANVNPASYV